jgi:hypothetical protein
MIANNIRTSLDNVITNATGEGYSALKKVYGSLKSIEKDVAHRSIVDARKNVKGLIDFTDIFSAGDIISGIATMNPAQIAKGGFQKAIATVYKKLNDPNRTIKKMFQGAEKYIQRKETPFTPKSYTGKAVQSMKGKGGMSIQDVSGGRAVYSDALIQEAKKYKSAEEFVSSQDNTWENFMKKETSKSGKLIFGKEEYGKFLDSKKGIVVEQNDPILKNFDFSSFYGRETLMALKHYNNYVRQGRNDTTALAMIENAYNSSIKDNIETITRAKQESQLTDLWKKANEPTKRGFGTGAGRTAGESKATLVKDASTKIDNYISNLKPKFMELDAMDALDELKKMKTQLSQKSLKAQDVKDIVGDADKLVKETLAGRAKKLAPEIKSETELNKLTLEAKKNRYFDEFKKLHPNVDAGVLKSIFIRSRK